MKGQGGESSTFCPAWFW